MSNHYHLVLKLCPHQIKSLTDDEIIGRWRALFKGPLLIQRYCDGDELKAFERATVSDIVNVWRSKLCSISWFMRCLNQPIAQQANREDKCTGKFWESRFSSQALKSEEALISCMVYVDLNPVRAGIAGTPEESSYTSIKERLRPRFNWKKAVANQQKFGELLEFNVPQKPLMPLEKRPTDKSQATVLPQLRDYLTLLDWTGRIIRNDKRGHIDRSLPPILARLHITPEQWQVNTTHFEAIHNQRFNRLVPNIDTG